MTFRAAIMNFVHQDQVNFVLTNFMPRRQTTRLMGWFSRIEHPLICALSLRVWGFFADLDLSDARETEFNSMHQCFTRRLKDGARPVDTTPSTFVSPCDGIVGACGMVKDGQILQVKGFSYPLAELLGDAVHATNFRNGCYVTLRLTSAMYHRFHAPHDCRVDTVTHIFGDTWNVNPVTLKRVKKLFCRNERAVIRATLTATGHQFTLVPVAAILVAGIRLRFLDMPRERGTSRFSCNTTLRKGEEMGWFEHGSTIIVLAPEGFTICSRITDGATIRVGEKLLELPDTADGMTG